MSAVAAATRRKAQTSAAPRRRRPVEPVVDLPVPDDYDARYLACRDLRHAWEERGWYRGSGGGIHRFLTCLRCGTERHDDDYAYDLRRHYRYPPGYALDGRVDVRQLRLAVRSRAKDVHGSLDDLRSALGAEVDLR